jgi:hypothetical protein
MPSTLSPARFRKRERATRRGGRGGERGKGERAIEFSVFGCHGRWMRRGDYQSPVVEGESIVEGRCARTIDNRPYGLSLRDTKKISPHISPAGHRVLSIRIATPPVGLADIPLDEGDAIQNFSLRER